MSTKCRSDEVSTASCSVKSLQWYPTARYTTLTLQYILNVALNDLHKWGHVHTYCYEIFVGCTSRTSFFKIYALYKIFFCLEISTIHIYVTAHNGIMFNTHWSNYNCFLCRNTRWSWWPYLPVLYICLFNHWSCYKILMLKNLSIILIKL